jgi:hypothetical protein
MGDQTKKKKRTRTPGAVAKVLAIIERLPPDAKRKVFLTECERLGINRNTAKTQWDNLRAERHQRPLSVSPLVGTSHG